MRLTMAFAGKVTWVLVHSLFLSSTRTRTSFMQEDDLQVISSTLALVTCILDTFIFHANTCLQKRKPFFTHFNWHISMLRYFMIMVFVVWSHVNHLVLMCVLMASLELLPLFCPCWCIFTINLKCQCYYCVHAIGLLVLYKMEIVVGNMWMKYTWLHLTECMSSKVHS